MTVTLFNNDRQRTQEVKKKQLVNLEPQVLKDASVLGPFPHTIFPPTVWWLDDFLLYELDISTCST